MVRDEAGARSQGRVHTPGTHSPETTTGAGIAIDPGPRDARAE